MDREKIPRILEGTGTFVVDPEDDERECAQSCCRRADPPTHWGQWLRPA
ncbi:hypothetical protein [Saccharothrix sp. ST-888]|nr:hypothetical protein [Saccharothrix sp. ST-888]